MRVIKTVRINRERGDTAKWASDPRGRRGVQVAECGEGLLDCYTAPPLKKSLFPVQRVAEIVASRAAANFFFPSSFFLFL